MAALAIPAVAAFLSAAACSSRPSAPLALPAAQVSGSRMRARFLSGPDGLRIPAGWLDSQFGAPCKVASSGGACLPDPAPTYAPTVNSVQDYSDAACTMPVLDLPVCKAYFGDPPVFVADQTLAPTRYEMVTATVPAGTQAYVLKTNCIPAQELANGYVVSPPLSNAAFAQFGAPTPAGTGRLRPLYRNSEDGAQELVGIHDADRGAPCAPLTAGDGTLRCLPLLTDAVNATLYADAACTQVAVASQAGGDPPLAYTVAGTGSCLRQRVDALGAVQTMPTVYTLDTSGCTVVGPFPGDFVVGDELAPETFEALTVREAGAGRIREQVLATADGVVVGRGYGWRDTRLDAPVYADMIDGGRQALVPTGPPPPQNDVFFSDAACAQREPLVEAFPDACTPAPRYVTAPGHVTPNCGAAQVFRLGQPVDERRVYFADGSGGCALETTPAPTRQLLPVGAALDPSMFVTVTVGSE